MTQSNPPAPDTASAENILRKRDPELLGKIEAADVDKDDRLVAGPAPLTPKQWRKAAEVLKAALAQGLLDVVPQIENVRKELLLASRSTLVADIIAVVGPASIFTVLKTDHATVAQYLSAGFALLAAILAVIARYRAQDPLRPRPLLDDYKWLTDWKGRASAVIREIEINFARTTIGPDQQDLLNQASELCEGLEGRI